MEIKARKIKNIDELDENCMSFTQHIIKEIVAKDDENTKQVILDYAMKKSAEIGQEIRVDFIDKEIVDEIIKLGIEAYNRKK